MEYLQQILKSTPRDFAGSVNAEVQVLCMRYAGSEAHLDYREDGDMSVHCNWSVNGHFSNTVRFEWDLSVTTFGTEIKKYNLIDPEAYEQLLFDTMDSLVPGWG